MTTLFIGTYTRDSVARGVYRCEWDPVSGRFTDLRLAVEADNPSFLCVAHGSLFAVHELATFDGDLQGAVAQYRPVGARLEQAALFGSGGAHPCHLAVAGARLAVANYSGSSVALFDIENDVLTRRPQLMRFTGRGPHRRQSAPHPHGVYFADDELLVPDLGLDRIHRLDPATGALRGAWSVDPGSGPRHLTRGPNGCVYVLNELANRIDVLRNGIVAQSRSTLPAAEDSPAAGAAESATTRIQGASTAAGIALSADGTHLVVSNRGHDSLASFPVDPDTGHLGTPAFTACDPHPRHFLLMPGWVIVASRTAGTLTAFESWPGGSVGPAVARIACPAPVCVAAWPDQPVGH